jgi:CRISPR-associated endonuclease/helicase Cas3
MARTGGELFAEPDLQLWLRDRLENEQPQCGFVARKHLPADPASAAKLLEATPPLDEEVYPAPLGDTRAHVRRILDAGDRVFTYRAGSILQLDQADEQPVRPGDVLIVDEDQHICRLGVVTYPADSPGTDIYDTVAAKTRRFVAGMSPAVDAWLAAAAELLKGLDDPDKAGDALWEAVLPLLDDSTATALAQAKEPDWFWNLNEADQPDDRWLVVSTAEADEHQRQTYSYNVVLLDDHNNDVADRARALGTRLGLPHSVIEDLYNAGLGHDLGKRDPRFQRDRLGNRSGPLRAKGPGRRRSRLAPELGGLPPRWRHEQLSAAIAHTDRYNALVVRLIGTSHGFGRAGFPHATDELFDRTDTTPVRAAAATLFDDGVWDTLIERTDSAYGVWGCAYLEAVLRAADAQISGEGK